MVREPNFRSEKKSEADSVALIIGTIGDTTWRMFVPSIGLTLLGVWADGRFGTKPWLMFCGIMLGLLGAVMLVRRQISTVRQKEVKK